MIDLPGDHPLPHPELRSQEPLTFTLNQGEVLYRHHQSIHDPIFFGLTGRYRLDDPACPSAGSFAVLYAGGDPDAVSWNHAVLPRAYRVVSSAYLGTRQIARMELTEDLRFIDLVEPGGLTSIGADGRLVTGSYKVAQHWSAALKKHPTKPDGIRYRSRHAPERIAYAIYTRSPATFSVSSMGSFMDATNEDLFKMVLKTYKLALI